MIIGLASDAVTATDILGKASTVPSRIATMVAIGEACCVWNSLVGAAAAAGAYDCQIGNLICLGRLRSHSTSCSFLVDRS